MKGTGAPGVYGLYIGDHSTGFVSGPGAFNFASVTTAAEVISASELSGGAATMTFGLSNVKVDYMSLYHHGAFPAATSCPVNAGNLCP